METQITQPRFVLDTAVGLEVSFQHAHPTVTHHVCNTGTAGGSAEVVAWIDGYEVGRQAVWAEVHVYAMFTFDLGELHPGRHRVDVAVSPADDSGTHALHADFDVPSTGGATDAWSVHPV